MRSSKAVAAGPKSRFGSKWWMKTVASTKAVAPAGKSA
jgi:hypothetical protein